MRTLLVLATLIFPASTLAQTKEQDIETLLQAMQWQQQVEASYRAVRRIFVRQPGSANKGPARFSAQEFDAAFPVTKVLEELHPKAVKVYADKFSHEEIRELVAIYRTPVFVKQRAAMDGELGRLTRSATSDLVRDVALSLPKKEASEEAGK